MVLHTIAIHDDAVATAGTDIAAADFIDGEDKVIMRQFDGVYHAPTLLDVQMMTYDAAAAAGNVASRYKIQPNPWPETKTIGDRADIFYGSKTADAGVTPILIGPTNMVVMNKLGIECTNNLDWCNPGNSVVYATTADEDFMILLQMSYGPVSLSRGGKILYVPKAFGAVAVADVWDQAYSEVFTDDSPGLDPDMRYRLHALGVTGAGTVATDAALGVRISTKGGTTTPAVLGSGGVQGLVKTVFVADSIEFNGNAILTGETVGTATNDGGIIHHWFEEIGPAITGGSQGGSAGRALSAPVTSSPGTGRGSRSSGARDLMGAIAMFGGI